MTTLMTGATGFVGSAVLRRLGEAGREVRVMVRENTDRSNLVGVDCQIVTGDLNDPASLKAAVAGCDSLFHVAADYRLWVPDPENIYRTNVEGTRHLMRAAADAGVDRIVYTSSVATLGLNPDGTPSDETTPVGIGDMVGHYKRSKFLAEQTVQNLVAEEALPAVIVNPSAPVGPRDIRPTPTGQMIVEAASGRMPAYVDTGLNVVHVDDVAEGHMLAFERGAIGSRYVLGGQNMALRDILAVIAELTGRPAPKVRLPHGLVLPVAYVAEAVARLTGRGEPIVTVDGVKLARKLMYFSTARAETELGYRSRPATDAIRDAIEWFRANDYLD